MSKLTVTLEYENKDDPLVKQLMENFASDRNEKGGAIVYAMAREDLFQKIETIEEVLGDWDMTSGEKLSMIREVL
jgi:hypothetical protein|tara:strand:- start:521 stop:745 length:225 start_codon:yes stop_codon:yes gene_type:complete